MMTHEALEATARTLADAHRAGRHDDVRAMLLPATPMVAAFLACRAYEVLRQDLPAADRDGAASMLGRIWAWAEWESEAALARPRGGRPRKQAATR